MEKGGLLKESVAQRKVPFKRQKSSLPEEAEEVSQSWVIQIVVKKFRPVFEYPECDMGTSGGYVRVRV